MENDIRSFLLGKAPSMLSLWGNCKPVVKCDELIGRRSNVELATEIFWSQLNC